MTYTKCKIKTTESIAVLKHGSLEWYISEVCGGMDPHEFTDSHKAREFGLEVREKCPSIDVEINLKTVRLRLK